MYKCEVCNKEFEKLMALCGHKAWHVKRTGLDKVAAKLRGIETIKHNIENYMLDPLMCKQCNEIIPYEKYTSKKNQINRGSKYSFCNSSCAARFNNSKRIVSEKTKKKTSEMLLKKHASTKHLRENNIHKNYAKYTKYEIQCSVCLAPFVCAKDKKRKTCSESCKNLARSIQRQKFLEKNGNFSTPREVFTYKNVCVEVDSNLEKAGIIYLIDKLNAQRIERFKNLIHYNDGTKNRTYNPDFICSISGTTHIIEIKQKWNSTSKHIYNTSIPHKKKALENYCLEKGYISLWLDFDTTPCLKAIYSKVLKHKKKLTEFDLNE